MSIEYDTNWWSKRLDKIRKLVQTSRGKKIGNSLFSGLMLIYFSDDLDSGEENDRSSNPFFEISRMNRAAKRITRHNLSHCRHYKKYLTRWDRVRNGMAKGYRRITEEDLKK